MATLRLCAALLLLEPCAGFMPLVAGRLQPNTSASKEPRVVPLSAQENATEESPDSALPAADERAAAAGDESVRRSRFRRLDIRRYAKQVFGSLQPLLSRGLRLAGVADEDLRRTASHTLAWVCYGALALTLAGTVGVDVKPLLGLSTLFGFALSISAKSILSNTFSAAYVMWVRPFKRGDRITVCEFGKSDKYSGTVLSIDYHFVRLLTNEGNVIMVPSHAVYGKVVELPAKKKKAS
jgi:hypothetical protein